MAVDIEIVKQLVEYHTQAEITETYQRQISSPYDLPIDWRIDFEERVAILEYDGDWTREDAEMQAFDEIQKRMEINNWN